MRHGRILPLRERFSLFGDLAFWLSALIAASLVIVALARPQALTSLVRRGSADIVILQDASASMYVSDVRPDRWRRSVLFLRTFAESLSWQGDRVALALFAQLAAPQVRLTKDPNSLFFFIDHLGEHSPFPLENAPTWDTNIEEGLRWGLRLVEKDEELFGKSGNPKAFLVISDGQSWSGKVAVVAAGGAAAEDSGLRGGHRHERWRHDSRAAPGRRHAAAAGRALVARPQLAGADCRGRRRRLLRARRRTGSSRGLSHRRSASASGPAHGARRNRRGALQALPGGRGRRALRWAVCSCASRSSSRGTRSAPPSPPPSYSA